MWILQAWSINYALRFRHGQIHKQYFLLGFINASLYRKFTNFTNFTKISLLCLLIFTCSSWVCKLRNIFVICLETEAMFLFWGYYYCHLWKVQFQLIVFFFLACKFFKTKFYIFYFGCFQICRQCLYYRISSTIWYEKKLTPLGSHCFSYFLLLNI